jgi:ABC-2 type transport system permease protein
VQQLIYDSAQPRRPVFSEIKNLATHRGLLRLLIVRDLTLRYKRSTLGVWWTLLNPLLTSLILWIVFAQFFRFEIPDVPFVVYLLSGILTITFFSQAVMASGSAIVNNAGILTKVYVPAEVFSFAAGFAAAVNFLMSLVPLFVIQLLTGVGIPWTVLLVPISIVLLLAFAVGLGLLVASAAVAFYDVIDFTGVLLQLVGYLTPTFYPVSIVPSQFLLLIYANPLYSHLTILRGLLYEGALAPPWMFGYAIFSALAALALGVWVFGRSQRRLVVSA